MTKEEILELAKEYDLIAGEHGITLMGIVNFAKLIANYEREACAKIVEANADACSTDSLAQMYLYSNATAIRARGQE